MIEFHKITNDLYILTKNGVRVTDIPLKREELDKKICDLKLSDEDIVFIERFYGGEKIGE